MAVKVITSKVDWDGFIRRAKRSFPNEHIEAIWGEETVDSYRITDFKKIKVDKRTPSSVEYDEAETKRQKWLASKAGKTFLGTVHTHPRKTYDTAPSQEDHHDGISDGEKIMGVVIIYRKENSDRFVVQSNWWFPQRPIEFVVLPR